MKYIKCWDIYIYIYISIQRKCIDLLAYITLGESFKINELILCLCQKNISELYIISIEENKKDQTEKIV